MHFHRGTDDGIGFRIALIDFISHFRFLIRVNPWSHERSFSKQQPHRQDKACRPPICSNIHRRADDGIGFRITFNDFTNHTDFSSAIIRINLRLIEMSIRLFLRSQARAFFERFGNISIGQHDWGSGQFAGQHDTGRR